MDSFVFDRLCDRIQRANVTRSEPTRACDLLTAQPATQSFSIERTVMPSNTETTYDTEPFFHDSCEPRFGNVEREGTAGL